jgi:hemoglobin
VSDHRRSIPVGPSRPDGAGRPDRGADGSDTLYARVGGTAWFSGLVDRFYGRVPAEPALAPMYPDDLTEAKRHLALFLGQYFGGPAAYNAERGHPRLRMRHAPFVIGPAERDAWLRLMTAAVQGGGLAAADENEVLGYFATAASMLMNAGPTDGAGTGRMPGPAL